MGVSQNPSRVAELNFRIFDRNLHPDWFATRAFRRVTRETWEADIRVVAGGHAIIWRSGAIRLTEWLAGPESLLPEFGQTFDSPVKRERSARMQPGGGVDYQTCFEVERLDREVFAHLAEELRLDNTPGDLIHQFASTNRLSPSPMTRIHIEPRVRGLTVHTFHTFPDELSIVRTQSLFELRPALTAR